MRSPAVLSRRSEPTVGRRGSHHSVHPDARARSFSAGRLGLAIALAAAIAGTSSGCSVVELLQQADRLQRGVATIQGEIRTTSFDGAAPLVLVLSRDAPAGEPHPVEVRFFRKPGPFLIRLAPGRYEIAAFQDLTGDLVHNAGEDIWVSDEALTLAAGDRVEGLLLDPVLGPGTLPARFDLGREGETQLSPVVAQLGEVVSLDDPRLSLEMGRKGLWRPGEYLDELEAGLFFLEPYDERKTPVLFLHGIGGAPVQFRAMIGGLDRSRYQAWLFAYPSALPLTVIANALHQMIDVLDSRYGLTRVYVVAHSMGGLVARAFVNEMTTDEDGDFVRLLVTVATPFGGHAGANYFPGDDAPDAPPPGPASPSERAAPLQPSSSRFPHLSWRDMKPGSRFLRGLFARPLRPSLHFHLAFSFLDRPSALSPPNDGVVSLASQLRMEAQREARSQRGFTLDHDAVLESDELSRWVTHLFANADGR